MKYLSRVFIFFLVWSIATGGLGAPMWAGWIGGLIVALLLVPEKPA
jgi:hypothetical protein